MATELEQNLNKQEVESKDFSVVMADGSQQNYMATDEYEYQWAPTQAGGLLIYRKTLHAMFSAVIKDERVLMLAAGEWKRVEIIE